VGWRGGRSRRLWQFAGKPKKPRRLCDLLHIVYREASDRRASTGDWVYRRMLRPDLPKENIDGEAIEWAVSRLKARPERRRVLLVLSDGAPVDDSTLHENGGSYLSDHLRAVIARGSAELAIGGLGLEHHASQYYATYADVQVLDQLAPALFGLLESVILGSAAPGVS
jgi:cobaltochelatase CobT